MESNEDEVIKVGSLLDEAQKRKERLKNLKRPLESKNESKTDEDVIKSLPKYVY